MEATMGLREEVDQTVKFRLSAAPLAQQVLLGRKPGPITTEQFQQATAMYLRGLHDGLLQLADAVDRLQIGEGEG